MNEHVALPDEGLSAQQRTDIATLLVQCYLPRAIQSWAESVLGAKAISDVIGNKPPIDVLASSLVERLHQAGRLEEAVAILKWESRNITLLRGVNHILTKRPLAELAGLKAVVQAKDDPLLGNEFFKIYYPRVQRTVCAIGLGSPVDDIVGTGFLIAPDLVLTNFHVMEAFLEPYQDGDEEKIRAKATAKGDRIFCFFDYYSGPRPPVPPESALPHSSVVVRAATEGWLVRARRRLSNEGIPPYAQAEDIGDKYDYAVIRLEKSMGDVPALDSGGDLRGWLTLDSEVSFFDDVGRRLFLFQHPQGGEQRFDWGVYRQLDPSKTRIWYALNSMGGSSGSPAVDKKGRLYALHNASVTPEGGGEIEVNQGVRIDMILADLNREPKVVLPPLLDNNIGYWSLSDNANDPKPIIGREGFRQSVTKMMSPAVTSAERILAVTGPASSGRRFSIELLRRIVGSSVSIVSFGPTDLAKLKPKAFVEALAGELMLPDIGSIPDPKPTETTSRWSKDIPTWLEKALAADQERNPARYPVWVVINTVVGEGERLSWAADLPDLLSALMGPPDVAQVKADLPGVRWLLLGSPNSAFPPTRAPPILDDLTTASNMNYARDFVSCLSLAWRSLRPAQAGIGAELLETYAEMDIEDAKEARKPVQTFLASRVSRVVKKAQARR
jgi:hypothetical protein